MDGYSGLLKKVLEPKERAKRLRTENPQIDAEWDFSACPNKDIEEWDELSCWEHVREIPSIIRFVQKLRAPCEEKSFDCFWATYGQQLRTRDWQKIPRTYDALFYFAPDWPEKAYLSVEKVERKRQMRLIWPEAGKEFISGIVQESFFANHYLSENFREELHSMVRMTGKPTVQHNTNSTDAIFHIKWELPDSVLKEGFDAWLELNRPPGTFGNQRGEGKSLIKNRQTEMRHLAAWRLLGKYRLDYAAAEELTRKNGKQALYNGQDYWLEAKRAAEIRLREMADFVTGRRA